MRPQALGVTLTSLAAAALLAACSSGSAATGTSSAAAPSTASPSVDSTAPEAPTEVTTVVLGSVPSIELGVIEVAREQGFLAEAGIDVEIVPVDSGPNVVTGVVAGQYDVGWTAYAPPLLALAEGAPLKFVAGLGTVGESGTNGGLLVKADSGIQTWSDLSGKAIATNAPRSLFSLTVPVAIDRDGGDSSGIELVPLPFNQIAKAVADGQVDAGVVLEPFLTAGLAEHPDLVNLGDSTAEVLPLDSGSSLFFTSTDTEAAKPEVIAAFQSALLKTYEYANANLSEVQVAGAPLAGLDPDKALEIPIRPFKAEVSPEDLRVLLDLMIEYAWITQAPDLTVFLP